MSLYNMSLYNMIHGFSPAVFLVLPMLDKHPDEYPRFRDCFINDKDHPEYDNYIQIYTRTGGANRKDFEEENQIIKNMDNFVADFDDKFDSTFASWLFKVPEKWKDDFDKIIKGKTKEVSEEYRNQLKKIFPKLKDKFDEIFK